MFCFFAKPLKLSNLSSHFHRNILEHPTRHKKDLHTSSSKTIENGGKKYRKNAAGERERKRENGTEKSAKIDKISVIVRTKVTTTCVFLCFTIKALEMCFLFFSHHPRNGTWKLHCDVYLKIIRQDDLVDISISVWTVAFNRKRRNLN